MPDFWVVMKASDKGLRVFLVPNLTNLEYNGYMDVTKPSVCKKTIFEEAEIGT